MSASVRRPQLSLLPLLLAATLGGACGSSSTEAPASSSTQAPAPSRTAAMTRSSFGTLPDGQAVEAFTLTNAHGMEVKAITLGGIITSLKVPDKAGQLGDVVLGYDALQGYLDKSPFFGTHRRPLWQPHRQGDVHDWRHEVLAADQQRREPPARRTAGLRQGQLEGRALRASRRRGRRVHAHQPRWRHGLPGHAAGQGHLHADQRQHAARRLRGDDRQGDATST